MQPIRFRYPDDEIGWLWPTGGGSRKKPSPAGPKRPLGNGDVVFYDPWPW